MLTPANREWPLLGLGQHSLRFAETLANDEPPPDSNQAWGSLLGT